MRVCCEECGYEANIPDETDGKPVKWFKCVCGYTFVV